MKPYTVIGCWRSANMPWIEHIMARDPEEAASLAVWMMLRKLVDVNGNYENGDHLEIIDVIEGHHKGVLGNDNTISGTEAKETILKDKKLLPTFMGISPDLDKAIEEALK